MFKVIIIMGKSSSGKDTIYKELMKRTQLKEIVPYTTRPQRTGEIDGKDYYFVTNEYLEANKAKIIESRTYDTIYGPWTYGELLDHQITEDSNYDYLLVVTPEGCKGFQKFYGKENIIPLYIYIDDGIRLERALNRERKQKSPKYSEMCRRYLADEKDFSDEVLAEIGVSFRFENNNLEEVISEIIDYLKKINVRL